MTHKPGGMAAAGRWLRALPWSSSLACLTLLMAGALVAHTPSRWALAQYEEQQGASFITYCLIGLAVDTRDFLPVFFVGLTTLAWLSTALPLRRRPGARALGLAQVLWLVPAVLVLMALGIAATQFRIERGLYPTAFDLATGFRDLGFIACCLDVFFRPRFLGVSLAGVGLLALLVTVGLRQAGTLAMSSLRRILLTGILVALVSLGCHGLHRSSPYLFTSIPNWESVESPLLIFWQFGTDHENINFGSIWLLEQMEASAPAAKQGGAVVGLPTRLSPLAAGADQPQACQRHPHAEPFSLPGEAAGDAPSRGAVEEALVDLSGALFDSSSQPVHLWQVLLESFRSEDVNAFNPAAPPGLVPFFSSLYKPGNNAEVSAIVSTRVLQAGVRTSQALSAVTCGIGTLALGLSFARDLGVLPFRCLPDILRDAGFQAAFYYGSDPSFDNMLAFLRYHGVQRIMSEHDYKEEVPHEGWSVPDKIVATQAVQDAYAAPSGSRYNLLMTLSNHFPHRKPADFPPEISARVARLIHNARSAAKADDVARLEMMAYTDHALAHLVRLISSSPHAGNSVIFAMADHNTGDAQVWWRKPPAALEVDRLHAKLPFAILLPRKLIESAAHPDKARQAVARLNALLARTPLSQNDVPRMVLALLSAHPALRTIKDGWRWHNLGGQALSSHFSVPGHPEATALGIGKGSRVFWGSTEGKVIQTEEVATPTLDLAKARQSSPLMSPTLAWMGELLRGHARRCWSAEHIRHRHP